MVEELNFIETKMGQRYEQMIHYFETGEYIELDPIFEGVEPFRYDFNNKEIYMLDDEKAMAHIVMLMKKHDKGKMIIDTENKKIILVDKK